MRLLALLIGLFHGFITASMGLAQGADIALRAGEHADFTRLVMPLPEGMDWRFVETDRSIDIIFSDPSLAVDLTKTFDRIPRTRLRSVTQIAGGLRLQLACSCPARRVDGVPGQLVLDIQSPEPDATPEQTVRPQARPVADRTRNAPQSAGIALARRMKGEVDHATDTALVLHAQLMPGRSPLAGADEPEPPNENDANMMTAALGGMIAGAVASNLLTPEPEFRAAAPPDPVLVPEGTSRHILAQEDRRDAPEGAADQLCFSAASAQIADWSGLAPEGGPRTDWQTLYDPLDRLDEDAASALAIAFLQIGFGAEARSILSLLPAAPAADVLRQLTYVIDLDQPPAPDILVKYAECSDLDMLWAVLGDPAQSLTLPNAENRIVRATQALSAHLRHHLGNTIINTLLQHDAPDAAKLVQAVLDRSVHPASSGTRSQTLLTQPEALGALSGTDLMDLPDSDLLLILQNALDRGLTVTPELLALAVDRQFALRRSDLGRRFANVAARLLARAQQYDAAFRIANAPETDLAPENRAALLSDLFNTLAQTATDTEFVTTTFKQSPWATAGLSADVRGALRRRLDTLGFPEAAQQMLRSPQPDPAPTRAATAIEAAPARSTPMVLRGDRALSVATPQPPGPAGPVPQDPVPPAPMPVQVPPDTAPGPRAEPNATTTEDVPGTGLLSQGRQTLDRSAELRKRVQDLIGGTSTGAEQ